MAHCKKCLKEIRADCVLSDENICVFCYYNIKKWESNGQIVKKKDVIRKK